MVANFSDYVKLQDLLLESFIAANIKDSELHFFGTGEKMKELRLRVEQMEDLQLQIYFHGFTNQQEIMDHLLESNAFCLCTKHEGLSKAIAEAMMLGVPLIASDVEAINTYVQHGYNGYLVQNTIENWTSALQHFVQLSDEELTSLSEKQLNYAKEHFDVMSNARKYEQVFSSLLKVD